MIVVAWVFFGLLGGLMIDIVWASIDALIGTATLTAGKGLAVIGLCVIGLAVLTGVMVALGEFSSARRDRGPDVRSPTLRSER